MTASRRTAKMFLVLALYLKVTKQRTKAFNQFTMTDKDVEVALDNMMLVTETTEDELTDDDALMYMAINFALSFDSFRENARYEQADYNSMYN